MKNEQKDYGSQEIQRATDEATNLPRLGRMEVK